MTFSFRYFFQISRSKSDLSARQLWLNQKAAEEQALVQEARIQSAKRRTKSAQKDITKFMNRAPPARVIVARGQNIEGIGYELDANYSSVSGLWEPTENAVKVFAKDTEEVMVTSGHCSKIIAQQVAAAQKYKSSVDILVGRNGVLTNPGGVRDKSRESVGEPQTPVIADDFERLSDTDYGNVIPGDTPLSWNDQLQKPNIVVKIAKKKSPSKEKVAISEPPKFKTLLEEEEEKLLEDLKFSLKREDGGKSFVQQFRPVKSAGLSNIRKLGSIRDSRDFENPETDELVRQASAKNRDYVTQLKRLQKTGPETPVHDSEAPSVSVIDLKVPVNTERDSSGRDKGVITSPHSVNSFSVSGVPKLIQRPQTTKPWSEWSPTALDIHDRYQKTEINYPLPSDRSFTSKGRRARSTTVRRSSPTNSALEYTPIVMPLNYKMQQKAILPGEDQVINVIIASSEQDKSTMIGARLASSRGARSNTTPSLGNRARSGINVFPPTQQKPSSGGSEQTFLVYPNMERKPGTGYSNDEFEKHASMDNMAMSLASSGVGEDAELMDFTN